MSVVRTVTTVLKCALALLVAMNVKKDIHMYIVSKLMITTTLGFVTNLPYLHLL